MWNCPKDGPMSAFQLKPFPCEACFQSSSLSVWEDPALLQCITESVSWLTKPAVLPDCLPLLSHRPYPCKSSRKTLKAPLQQTPTTTRRLLTAPASLTSRSTLLPTAPGRYTPPASWAAPPLCKEAPSGKCQLQMLTPWPRHRPMSASTPSSWTWAGCALLTSWAQKHWARWVLCYSQAPYHPSTFHSLVQFR